MPGERLQRDAASDLLSRLPGLLARCDAEAAEAREHGNADAVDAALEARHTFASLGKLAETALGRNG